MVVSQDAFIRCVIVCREVMIYGVILLMCVGPSSNYRLRSFRIAVFECPLVRQELLSLSVRVKASRFIQEQQVVVEAKQRISDS